MGYLGVPPQSGFITTDSQRVTSSTNNYVDLDNAISSLDDVIVYVNSVKQDITNLTLTTSTRITLGGTLTSSDVVEIVYLGKAVATQTPGTGTVTNDMLAGSIANAKLANSSITLNGSAVSLGGSATVGGDNTPYFVAYRNANQTSLTNSGYTALVMNAEVVDSANAFDTSTGRFTPQTAGYYYLTAGCTVVPDSNTAENNLGIFKNTNGDPEVANKTKLGSANLSANTNVVSGIIQLNGSSDYVQPKIYLLSTSGYAQGEKFYTYFMGYKLIT